MRIAAILRDTAETGFLVRIAWLVDSTELGGQIRRNMASLILFRKMMPRLVHESQALQRSRCACLHLLLNVVLELEWIV